MGRSHSQRMDVSAILACLLLGAASVLAEDLSIETEVEQLGDFHGTIKTPNYPSNYHNDYEGIWELNIPPTGGIYTLVLVIDEMDIEGTTGHCSDYIKIDHKEYCGQSPFTIRVPDIEYGIVIDFHTDSSVTGKGFKADYEFVPQY
ncbi:suppressor of tumorigenicity 14 protein homolog isoform X1 [Haliotis rufescens]|uniref:suppressor of tumorigenicity 14 protein homolog isoform X1 n=2 Tax=Haliotis rufescens TaxID=6454 RepID=UPI00201F83EF|nr:suppressor of tumorigenicity 14 protein homolog isoform X1 [Haliotis rufescens]